MFQFSNMPWNSSACKGGGAQWQASLADSQLGFFLGGERK